MHDWTKTDLWNLIKKNRDTDAEQVRAVLTQIMPRIQAVLSQGGTSPSDFSLHDSAHSSRVANRMCEVATRKVLVKLSVYELGLLLLAAYLHDIGMTPHQGQLNRYRNYILFGDGGSETGLDPHKAAELQAWLDEAGEEVRLPLAVDGLLARDTLFRALELLTKFARHKHNDWSKEWIQKNLSHYEMGSYENWLADLVLLCQSHHYDYEELLHARFDPRPIGSGGCVVHLRYLACVLRVADILDVDPERTPSVLFEHRAIAPSSIAYWYKDHDFSVHVDGQVLVIRALPRTAVVEKAIRVTADGIREELGLCAHLAREKPFTHCSFRSLKRLPHEWTFPESLALQVRPHDDSYVYIDGAFRPNTYKLLELLSGLSLYRDRAAAFREMVQNALDAVMEAMALERIRWKEPGNADRVQALAKYHVIEIWKDEHEGESWLVCSDTGAGMSRHIIENYLLVSGSSRRPHISKLERLCASAGFALERSGRFGIGVLSYFMLADRVEFVTRRDSNDGSAEPHGWYFETEGVGSFGELRRDTSRSRGTMVRCRLRPDTDESRPGLIEYLYRYLGENLVKRPCRLDFRDVGTLEVGWGAPPSSERLDPDGKLRWHEEEGELPDELGRYQILIPYLELPTGISGFFARWERFRDERSVSIEVPDFAVAQSWKGMLVNLEGQDDRERRRTKGFLLRMDWTSDEAGLLSINRTETKPSSKALKALRWALAKGEERRDDLFASRGAPEQAVITSLIYAGIPSPEVHFWPRPQAEGVEWLPIEFPVLATAKDLVGARLNWCGKRVATLPPVRLQPGTISWTAEGPYLPDRIVVLAGPAVRLFPIYCGGNRRRSWSGEPVTCSFPPNWVSLDAFVDKENGVLWNPASALRNHTALEVDVEARRRLEVEILRLVEGDTLLRLTNPSYEEDEAGSYRFRPLRSDFGLRDLPSIALWIQTPDLGALVHTSLDGYSTRVCLNHDHLIREMLPDPGDEWMVNLSSLWNPL